MMEIVIRKALPEDACDLTDCRIACFQTAYKGIIPDGYLDNMLSERVQRIEKYKKALEDPGDCEYYCVMRAGEMIGFLTLYKSRDENNSAICELWAIYLTEDFRGKGYGKEMLDFAMNELKLVEPDEISLWVFEENDRARRFYEKNNFHFDGATRTVTYGKPLIQLRYALNVW